MDRLPFARGWRRLRKSLMDPEKLTALHLKTRSANDERQEQALLADVQRRYWAAQGSKVRSAKSNRHCINVWLDHWQKTNVSALADVKR